MKKMLKKRGEDVQVNHTCTHNWSVIGSFQRTCPAVSHSCSLTGFPSTTTITADEESSDISFKL